MRFRISVEGMQGELRADDAITAARKVEALQTIGQRAIARDEAGKVYDLAELEAEAERERKAYKPS